MECIDIPENVVKHIKGAPEVVTNALFKSRSHQSSLTMLKKIDHIHQDRRIWRTFPILLDNIRKLVINTFRIYGSVNHAKALQRMTREGIPSFK